MPDSKMPFLSHLGELRKKIIICVCFLFAFFIVTFSYSEYILKLIMFPLKYNIKFSVKDLDFSFVPQDKLHNTKLVFLAPAEAFWVSMKVSLVAALIMSLPIIFHQLWGFVSPGLHVKEKKYIIPFVLSATVLFLIGSAFCFAIVLPFALDFLLNYKVGNLIIPMLSVGEYVDFCLKFILAFGVIFELPIVIIFLTRMGIVSHKTLAKNRKYAILAAFIMSAILTPTPDAFNQTLMAIPIIFLYEISIWISILIEKKITQKINN